MRLSSTLSGLLEAVALAIGSLRSSKARAALTILGVAIGVFVVVIMSAAIHGINRGVAAAFETAGPTTFFLTRFPISLEACDGSNETCTWRRNPPINVTEARSIARLSSVGEVTTRAGTSAPARWRDRYLAGVQVQSFSANWLEVDGGDIVDGRNFTPAEERTAALVVVINDKMAERLFGDIDPLGKTITIGSTPLQVVGIYTQEISFFGEGDRSRAMVPFETGRRQLRIPGTWMDLAIKPVGTVARDEAIDDVTALLRASRGLKPGAENTFAIITQEKLFETWGRMTGIFFLVMLVLSGVGLMVGGAGVVAIMMISVTERTREIGVRKALGATRATILWQFLVEAATLTGIGAMFGLAFGWAATIVIRNASPIEASIPPLAIVAALVASAFTGILFGLFPAARAARLDPVEALRHE
ncbi:MAG TPA: ABC transporter permease [Gemmatimonadaceae bacterium]|nr:ABC transporter permease [Gemmatimonadaceae bacterium]